MPSRAWKILSSVVLLSFGYPVERAEAQAELLMIGLCRKITDETARLKCYDAISVNAATSADETPKPKAEWKVIESKSPLDDSPQVVASLVSEDGNSNLILRCRERRTEAIVFPNSLFIYERGNVLLRLNDLPAASASWDASDNNKAVFAPNGINFAKMLVDDGALFIRVSGYQGKISDARFALGAVSPVREKLATACKWPEAKTKTDTLPKQSPKRQ